MVSPWTWGVAGFAAALIEAVAFNPLTVARSRAHAGQSAPLNETWREMATCGLPAMLAVTGLKRGSSIGFFMAFHQAGYSAWLAGAIVGAAEAWMFVPFRRVIVAQQGFSTGEGMVSIWRRAYRSGGLVALWSGGLVGLVRGMFGGIFYWGTIGTLMAAAPGMPSLLRGFIASLAATVLCNPLEVLLTCVMAPYPVAFSPLTMWRGTSLAVARSLPSATIGHWLTCLLADTIGKVSR